MDKMNRVQVVLARYNQGQVKNLHSTIALPNQVALELLAVAVVAAAVEMMVMEEMTEEKMAEAMTITNLLGVYL